MKDFKGYAVGGDDTAWREYITRRINDITKDLKTSTVDTDSQNKAKINKKMKSLLSVTQNLTGTIKL